MTQEWLNKNASLTLEQATQQVPNHIFSEAPFIEYCIRIAKDRFDDPLAQQVYANFLSLKSQATRQHYAITYLIQHGRLSQNSAQLPDTDRNQNLIDHGYRKRFFLKITLHRVYRLFKKPIKTDHSVIRAFIDTSETIFSNEIKTSGIFIYPTTTKLSRQWKLIKQCRKKYPNQYSLMGLPYSLKTALKCLTTKHFDALLVQEELRANMAHQHDFTEIKTNTLYTTDEFECTNVALYHNLSCTVINVAHGIGVCCPFVGHHKMINLHPLQNQYFQTWNPQVNCEIKPMTIHADQTYPDTRKLTVIFVHQPFDQLNLHYEHRMQTQVIAEISERCQKNNLPFKIKLHPGAKQNEQRHFIQYEWCKEHYLDTHKPIYFSLYSSAFFDFIKNGPYFLVTLDLLDPKMFFGDLVDITTLSNIQNILSELVNPSRWESKRNEQIAKLNHSSRTESCVE